MAIEKKTKTALFLLPAMGFNEKKLKNLGFINAFSYDSIRKHADCLYLLFLTEEQSDLGLFIEENKDKIADEIDYEKGYTVLVCPFPVKYIRDKEMFWAGKYSKFSKDFKALFKKNTPEMDVIIRDRGLRNQIEEILGQQLPEDSELASIPDKDKETLNIEHYVNPQIEA